MNLTTIHSLISSHDSKLLNLKKISNKNSNDNVEFGGKIITLKSNFEIEKLQLKTKTSKLEDKIIEIKSDMKKQAHKVREVENKLRTIENKPVERVDTTQIENDIEDIRSKFFEFGDNINTKFSKLNVKVFKLNNNITHQSNKNLQFQKTFKLYEAKIYKIENSVNRLEQINNDFENKINVINSSLKFNVSIFIKIILKLVHIYSTKDT